MNHQRLKDDLLNRVKELEIYKVWLKGSEAGALFAEFAAFIKRCQLKYNYTVSNTWLINKCVDEFCKGKSYSECKKMEKDFVKYLKQDPDNLIVNGYGRHITLKPKE